jgi:GNAT superfamily N-acetyltransferase
MERGDELVGVIAYCYPPIVAGGRKKAVGYLPKVDELNRDWAIISRVVVHPKYRTIGLGARLVLDTLPLCGRRYFELIAMMAQYNPFAERAGMRRVQDTEPHPSVWEAIDRLIGLGFNPVLLSSVKSNLEHLESLGDDEVDMVREALHGASTHYFKRLSRGGAGRAYVRKADMGEWLRNQGRGSLAKSIRILSIISETKVYLFWSRDWMEDAKDG